MAAAESNPFICDLCDESYTEHRANGRGNTCPKCRRSFGNVSDLVRNFGLLNAMSIIKRSDESSAKELSTAQLQAELEARLRLEEERGRHAEREKKANAERDRDEIAERERAVLAGVVNASALQAQGDSVDQGICEGRVEGGDGESSGALPQTLGVSAAMAAQAAEARAAESDRVKKAAIEASIAEAVRARQFATEREKEQREEARRVQRERDLLASKEKREKDRLKKEAEGERARRQERETARKERERAEAAKRQIAKAATATNAADEEDERRREAKKGLTSRAKNNKRFLTPNAKDAVDGQGASLTSRLRLPFFAVCALLAVAMFLYKVCNNSKKEDAKTAFSGTWRSAPSASVGRGEIVYDDGVYYGDYVSGGLRHGRGELAVSKNFPSIYSGEWDMNSFHGIENVTEYDINGETFTFSLSGQWKYGSMHGEGRYLKDTIMAAQRNDETGFEMVRESIDIKGSWRDNIFQRGLGTMTWYSHTDSSRIVRVYSGEVFGKNFMTGPKGVTKWWDEQTGKLAGIYRGEYKNAHWDGLGTMEYFGINPEIITGWWSQGQYIGRPPSGLMMRQR